MSKNNGFSRKKVSNYQAVEQDHFFAAGDYSNPQQGSNFRNEKIGGVNKRDPRKIFVGGLPGSVQDEEFRDFFTQFGSVIDSVVIFDTNTRRSRGFGFVTFEERATAERILGEEQFGSVVIRGRVCEVKPAEPKVHSHSRSRNVKADREQSSLSPHAPEAPPATVCSTASGSVSLSQQDIYDPPAFVAFDPHVPQPALMPYMPYPPESQPFQHPIPMHQTHYPMMHQPPFHPQIFYNNFFPNQYSAPFYGGPAHDYVMEPMHSSTVTNIDSAEPSSIHEEYVTQTSGPLQHS